MLLVYEEVVKVVDNGWTSDSPVLVGFYNFFSTEIPLLASEDSLLPP